MIAAIATIAFLAAAWAAIVILAGSLEGNLVKVIAALRGETRAATNPALVAGRVSQRYPASRPLRARAQLMRAAA